MKEKKSKKFLGDVRALLVIGSVLYIILAACLLFIPNLSLMDVNKAIGLLCVVAGVFEVIMYFIRKSYLDPQRFGFAIGMSLLLVGIYALVRIDEFTQAFAQILAIVMVFDGIVKMQFSMDLLRMKNKKWWLVLLLAFLMAGLAMGILLSPFEGEDQKLTFTYIVLLADGAVNIVTLLYTSFQLKKFQQKLYSVKLPDAEADEADAAEDAGMTEEAREPEETTAVANTEKGKESEDSGE